MSTSQNTSGDSGIEDQQESSGAPPVNCDFHIIAVGASAGGLEAIEKFFVGMPKDINAAFVIVQHLSPDFKSHMAELLCRKTSLEIKRVTNAIQVESRKIYLIPSNAQMMISNGRLLVTERDPEETLHLPIDHFFRSLADECGGKAIGVILSGTGSDGSRGVVAINESGGLVISQDEHTAKFDGMPISAQQTNSVHLVLPPERMGEVISNYIEQSLTPDALTERELVATESSGMDSIFNLLRREYRIDFSVYKPATVTRRIERRISLSVAENIDDYVQMLSESPEELNLLYHDMLINVTHLFRDTAAFEALQSKVVPEILKKKRNSHDPIRIWVAGCATGQEAYSIAIAFQEALEGHPSPPIVKIFATDVHQRSLHFASKGMYPVEAFKAVPKEIITKYFQKRPEGYEVTPTIRKMIVFAPHNVINDAPFTKLDLITCRNLLIYFQPIIQRKVFSLFHFALLTGAYMFLGPSETPGDIIDEFDVIDKKYRLYRKRRDVRLTGNIRLPFAGSHLPPTVSAKGRSSRSTPESQLLATYDRLLDRCMPPSFLADEQGQLIHTFGGAERFLQLRGGRASTGILDAIHDDLKTSVSGALQHAAKEQKEVRYTGIAVKTNLGIEQVRLSVDPIRDPRTEVVHTLITIEPIEDDSDFDPQSEEKVDMSELALNHISHLENDLRYAKENLQATVEELETSNEELQATNEELVASIEEMHSSNEELQSVNEELFTVNHEYQKKINELREMTDDMNNLFYLTEVGVIFLDRELKVRRFTPKIAEMFNLLPQDVGRSIENFTHNLSDETVLDNFLKVMESEEPYNEEVTDRHGNHWLLRIIPYRTKQQVDGVVVTLIDLNSVKETDAKLRRYRDIVESTAEAIIGADTEGYIQSWNPRAEELYGYTAEEIIGKHISTIVPESLRAEAADVAKRTMSGEHIKNYYTTRVRKDGEPLFISITVSAVYNAAGEVVGMSSLSNDLTDQRKAELEQDQLNALIKTTSDFVGVCDPEGNTLSVNPAGRRMLGVAEDDDVVGSPIANWCPEKDALKLTEDYISVAMEEGEWRGTSHILNSETGEEIALSAVITSHKDPNGEIAFVSILGRDVTQQIEFEKQLQERETFLRRTLDGLYAFAAVLTPEGELLEVNRTGLTQAGLKAEDVVGKSFPDLFWWSHSPDVQKRVREAIQTAAEGNIVRYDTTMLLTGDQIVQIDFQLTPLFNDEGDVTHLVPSGFDITDRIELDSQQRVFRYAFESSLTAMVITDATKPNNPIAYVNPGFELLTGYSKEEAIGKNCRFLQGVETDPDAIRTIREAVSSGKAIRKGLLNYRKTGEPFWNELIITPVRNESGELLNFVGVQLDMTKQQASEQRLALARDVAEAANAAKTSFIANMSHEIRTPLTTIAGMTEMLLDHESDKSKHDTLQLIHQSSRHLAGLVNDVLDLSKIEAGKLEADLSDVAPMQIIQDVGASLGYRAKEKGLSFAVEYDGMIPELIETDAVRFRQILFNLAGNAVKFTEEGGVTVRCKLVDPDTKPMLQIEVDDTGIGFKESEVESLFEQFTQVDDSPTRRRGGSGLGLFISRRIVELLDGELSARRKDNGGSVFILALPVGDLRKRTLIDPSTLLSKNNGQEKKLGSSDFDLGGRRVLVAEDTRGIQVLLKRILKTVGAEVDVVGDGQLVIEKLAANEAENGLPYDIILLDMHMPRLSGYEAAAVIRKTDQTTPIIALTASALKGDREKCLKFGCDDYLTKPIDRQKLLKKIVRQLASQ